MFFKGKEDINHRNKKAYAANLQELVKAIRKGEKATRELLLGGSSATYRHTPDHSACTYDQKKGCQRKTEKRLCRCIYFLNSPKEQQGKCKGCPHPYSKYILASGYTIKDYEISAPYNKHNGVDLIWTTPDGKTYAVEVKPAASTETIIRMVAEILTYTLPADGFPTLGKPAICFFKEAAKGKPSAQWREYFAWKDDVDFKTMLDSVHVFYFTSEGNKLTIHDAEKEPICK